MKTIFILLFFVACNNTGTMSKTAQANNVPTPQNIPDDEEEDEIPARIVPVVASAQELVTLYNIQVSTVNGGYSYSPFNYGSLCVKFDVPLNEVVDVLHVNAVNIGGDIAYYFELELNRENAMEYLQYLDNGGEKLNYPKRLVNNNCSEHGEFKDSLQSIHGAFISECMAIPLSEFSGVTDNDKAIQQDLLCNKNR